MEKSKIVKPSKVFFLTSGMGIVSVNDSFIPPIFRVNKLTSLFRKIQTIKHVGEIFASGSQDSSVSLECLSFNLKGNITKQLLRIHIFDLG